MNLSGSRRKKNDDKSFIFRGKSNRPIKSEIRVLIEALIMFAIGTNIIVFLYTLPGDFNLNLFLIETWFDFSQGILQLIDSLSKIGGAVVVLLLIAISLVLVLGSLSRLTRLFFRYKTSKRRNKNKP